MSKIKLEGERFGKLIVLRRSHADKHRHVHWICACDCGNACTVSGVHLKGGDTGSCGCIQRDKASSLGTKYGVRPYGRKYPKMSRKDWFHYSLSLQNRFKKYKLTEQDLRDMMDKRKGCCDICNTSLDTYHVDHNHETGKVRGLLCNSCNVGLGMFKDNIFLMEAAVGYIEEDGWRK